MKFTPLPKQMARTNKEENSLMIKPCCRFSEFYHGWGDEKTAVIYLKLRSKSCGKLKSKTFTSKPVCRVDSTRQIDGPASSRILNVRDHSSLTINVIYLKKLKKIIKRDGNSAD